LRKHKDSRRQYSHLQEIKELCTIYPPIAGASTGPRKAALANTGNISVLSLAFHMSDREPPAHVRGVLPKKPAKNRVANCCEYVCDAPAPARNAMYIARVTM
jgi:hypothetical protein